MKSCRLSFGYPASSGTESTITFILNRRGRFLKNISFLVMERSTLHPTAYARRSLVLNYAVRSILRVRSYHSSIASSRWKMPHGCCASLLSNATLSLPLSSHVVKSFSRKEVPPPLSPPLEMFRMLTYFPISFASKRSDLGRPLTTGPRHRSLNSAMMTSELSGRSDSGYSKRDEWRSDDDCIRL
jgi:hypothetical protein